MGSISLPGPSLRRPRLTAPFGASRSEPGLLVGGSAEAWLERPADPHLPGTGPRLLVLPGELAGVLGLELVVKRLGVVVVHQYEARARAKPAIGGKDHFVAAGWGHVSDVEHLVSLRPFASAGGETDWLGAGAAGQLVQGSCEANGQVRPGAVEHRPGCSHEPARPVAFPAGSKDFCALQEQSYQGFFGARRLGAGRASLAGWFGALH